MDSRSKKRNTPTLNYFDTNYRTEIKLVPIIMDYSLLQLDTLNFFLGVRLLGGSLPNFDFFNVNSQIFQRNRTVHLTNCFDRKFYAIEYMYAIYFKWQQKKIMQRYFHTIVC